MTAGVTAVGMHRYWRAHGRSGYTYRSYARHLPEYIIRDRTGLGIREFKNRWMLKLLHSFQGYDEKQMDYLADWIVENELWPKRRPTVMAELEQHLAAGRRVIIVTGIIEPILTRFLLKVPQMEGIGTAVVWQNGRFTGNLSNTFNVGPHKEAQLEPFGSLHTAYGDTGPDHFMLALSQHPVAVHPDKRLQRIAETKSWRVLT